MMTTQGAFTSSFSPAVAHSGSQTEASRYVFEVRVHAMIMLFNAVLMAFFGFRVWDIDTTVTGKPVWAATSQGLLPHGVSIVLIGIAGYCLLDAYRSSREAAVASAGTDSDDVESA